MRIALDYDETYTNDKNFWSVFIELCKSNGHEIKFVTFRYRSKNQFENADIECDAMEENIEIIYCNGKQKSTVYHADIWIDDAPITIPEMGLMERWKYWNKQ